MLIPLAIVAYVGTRLHHLDHPCQRRAGARPVLHHITGANAWQTALVLLALSEVIVRVGVIVLRGRLLVGRAAATNQHDQMIDA